jgi:aminotransferase EvaB
MNPANFLPGQYIRDQKMAVNHNYLTEQFSDVDAILGKIRDVVIRNDFTLGAAVDEFEAAFAAKVGAKYAVGVGSGTDAIFLSLKALGVGHGDEVITTPFTFYATIGAIVTAGAKPVFVDIGDDLNIDPVKIEGAITARTKAIVPVHWSGRPCEMDMLTSIVERHGIHLVQDACHAIAASYKGRHLVEFGDTACYSMHPLKNLNVWGDGGVIATNSAELARKLSLMRNHGLADRDTCEMFAYNSRLDTIQAVVALHIMNARIDHITQVRRQNAYTLDRMLSGIPGVTLLPRNSDVAEVFHLYQFHAEKRDELKSFLISKGVDAKIHYPVPMHLQPAAAPYGYRSGDFPNAEAACRSILSLPVHEFVTEEQVTFMVDSIRGFYQ